MVTKQEPRATVYPDGLRVGPPASETRGGSAALIDGFLCLVLALPVGFGGFAAYASATDGSARGTRTTVALLWGAALLVSFVNHVLLARWCGGSLGKLALGLHVVRTEDGRRPRFRHLVGRWLAGLLLVPFGILVLAIALAGGAGFGAPLSTGEWLGISPVHREVPEGPALTPEERAEPARAAGREQAKDAREARERREEKREARAREREAVARRVREGRGGPLPYGRRVWCAVLDLLFTVVVGTLVWFALIVAIPSTRTDDSDTAVPAAVMCAAYLGCSFLNRVVLNRTLRGSLGRRLLGLRTAVTKTGRPPGVPRLTLQWLLGLVLSPISFFFLLFGAAPPAQSIVGVTALSARQRTGPGVTAPHGLQATSTA
ncbi:RDD family protein [Streptomyces sp. NRRL F-5630]|uniref:RDD family protein n=1 Tax=Streptomyces sp. NRRL F-5630 TaxID=1463864 RepID=UPI000998AABB|nr:RDD family protein [Streptomyces sp. NRRL F-5630]